MSSSGVVAAPSSKNFGYVQATTFTNLLHIFYILVSGLSSFFIILAAWIGDLYKRKITQKRKERLLPSVQVEKKELRRPTRSLTMQRKLTVVLDLDETLVLTCFEKKIPQDLEMRVRSGKLQSLHLHCDPMGNGQLQKLVVFLRPGLLNFLHHIADFSEIILYSAALRSYARPLIDALDPHRRLFTKQLFRDSTVCTRMYKYVKDLSKLGSDLSRTVLVDNRAVSFLLQPQNGIRCLPFRGNDNDRELHKVIFPLLKTLSHLRDVRPALNNAFQMERWFKSKGFLL